MMLKRLYNHDGQGKPTSVRGVRVLHAGPKQKFSPDLVAKGAAQGWLAMGDGKITVKGENQTLVYRIVRTPGYYCSHCGEALDDSNSAKAHIEANHAGKPSPDPENPAGYMRTNAFKGVLEQSGKKGARHG